MMVHNQGRAFSYMHFNFRGALAVPEVCPSYRKAYYNSLTTGWEMLGFDHDPKHRIAFTASHKL